jgi:hypothetical protein
MVVLDDGSFWVFYGAVTHGVVSVSGFIAGSSTEDTTAQTFSSSDSLDFGTAPAVAAPISGTYTTTSFSGTITYSATNHPTFTGAPLATTTYDYSATPSLAALAGSWSMGTLAGTGTRVSIAADGTFTGVNDAGCAFTGAFTLDASGKNVFDADIKFGGGVCTQASKEFKGAAILTHADSATQLQVAGVDATKTLGVSASGTPITGSLTDAGGYGGAIDDPASDQFDMIVMPDGTYWVMYGSATNGVVDVSSFIHGTSTEDMALQRYSSSDAMDFGTSLQATIDGNYSPAGIDGTITYSATSHPTFSGTPLATASYDFSAAPSLSALAGSWDMASLAGQGSRIDVDSTGAFRGINDAFCEFTGTFTADASGKNVYDTDLTFQGGTCDGNLGTNEFKGIAILTHVGNSTQLLMTGIDVATGVVGIAATGASQSSSRSAAGGYAGLINDSSGHKFDMIVMDDGTFWVMYGTANNGVVNVTSFIEGTSTEDAGLQTFESTDARDFGLQVPADIVGEYTLGGSGSIDGVIEYSASNHPTFAGSPLGSAKYDYTATPVLPDLDGTWNMASLAGQGSQIVVTTGGGGTTFVGTNNAGCNFTGRFTIDASGKNVFDTDITFGGGVCPQGTDEYRGIAILTHISPAKQLVITGIDVATHRLGIAATGIPH